MPSPGLTERDDEITADNLKSFALNRLADLLTEGVEGSPFAADPILEVVLSAAGGCATVWAQE